MLEFKFYGKRIFEIEKCSTMRWRRSKFDFVSHQKKKISRTLGLEIQVFRVFVYEILVSEATVVVTIELE